jgi:hypothetical protein
MFSFLFAINHKNVLKSYSRVDVVVVYGWKGPHMRCWEKYFKIICARTNFLHAKISNWLKINFLTTSFHLMLLFIVRRTFGEKINMMLMMQHKTSIMLIKVPLINPIISLFLFYRVRDLPSGLRSHTIWEQQIMDSSMSNWIIINNSHVHTTHNWSENLKIVLQCSILMFIKR